MEKSEYLEDPECPRCGDINPIEYDPDPDQNDDDEDIEDTDYSYQCTKCGYVW